MVCIPWTLRATRALDGSTPEANSRAVDSPPFAQLRGRPFATFSERHTAVAPTSMSISIMDGIWRVSPALLVLLH